MGQSKGGTVTRAQREKVHRRYPSKRKGTRVRSKKKRAPQIEIRRERNRKMRQQKHSRSQRTGVEPKEIV